MEVFCTYASVVVQLAIKLSDPGDGDDGLRRFRKLSI
jgi:hypothetical protein